MTLEKHTVFASLEPLHESLTENIIEHIMVHCIDDSKLPCTPEDAKFVCFPTEVAFHQKVNLERTQLPPHMEQQVKVPLEEFNDIFSKHQLI